MRFANMFTITYAFWSFILVKVVLMIYKYLDTCSHQITLLKLHILISSFRNTDPRKEFLY